MTTTPKKRAEKKEMQPSKMKHNHHDSKQESKQKTGPTAITRQRKKNSTNEFLRHGRTAPDAWDLSSTRRSFFSLRSKIFSSRSCFSLLDGCISFFSALFFGVVVICSLKICVYLFVLCSIPSPCKRMKPILHCGFTRFCILVWLTVFFLVGMLIS